MTRTTSGLLASRRTEGVAVFMAKTHFEQVPLEVVRKIVEEQIRLETPAELDRGIRKKTLEEDLAGSQEQSVLHARTFSPVEI
jgi:hypothetical protein